MRMPPRHARKRAHLGPVPRTRIARLAGAALLLGGTLGSAPGCTIRDDGVSPPEIETRRQKVVTPFAAGSLVIPMDNTYQNTGMLRAYGLVYDLLVRGIPVHWAILPGKAQDGTDFNGTGRDLRTGAQLLPHNYAGGPFVVAASDAPAALPAVNAWLSANPGVNVHDMTAAFSADISRVLVGAPRIAVFIDGFQTIAYTDLNAAGIPDSQGNTWSGTSVDALSEAQIAGPSTVNDADGALMSAGGARYCHLTSMHYASTGQTTEVVQEMRSWLGTSNNTHGFMQCLAITAFENNASGRFITTNGLADGTSANPEATLVADHPLSQFHGALTVDTGLVDSMNLAGGGSIFRANTTTLINRSGDPGTSRMVWLTGFLDGDTARGRLTYLGGHDYSIATPVSINPLTNGVRLLLNSLFASGCATASAPPGPTVTLAKAAPASTSGSTITFTLTYTNSGPGVAESVIVRDPVPAGTAFVSATGGGLLSNATVVWTIGNLAAGASASVSFTVSVPADGTYTNTATLTYAAGLRVRTVASNTSSTVRGGVPDTTIVSGPAAVTTSTTASFDFSSTVAAATFECSLDGAAFAACTDPVTFSGLAVGQHTLQVRAVAPGGVVDPSPAMHTWTIDVTPPDTTIVSGPAAQTIQTSATFDFSSNETPVTFECSLDGAAFTACADPVTLSGLAEGAHNLAVRARDAAGNVDASPATHVWTVDLTAPDTMIVSGPPATGAPPSVTFDLASNEMPVTYQCSLDGAAFAACTDPATFANLSNGPHTFQARAVDAAGNVDPTPAMQAFVVDATVLDTRIDSAPTKSSNQSRAVFDLSSNRMNVTYECSLDGAAFAACTDPATFTGLADGPHRLEARARDMATGQFDVTPAFHDWTVDTMPPDTTIAAGPPRTGAPPMATFDFSSTETNVTYECSLDGAAFAACTDPVTFGNLAPGPHALSVRARDAAGNVDATPAMYDWVVGVADAGAADARPDAGPDSAPDAARDATADAALDGTPEAGADAAAPTDTAAAEASLFAQHAFYGTGCSCDLGRPAPGDGGDGGGGAPLLLLVPLLPLLGLLSRRRGLRSRARTPAPRRGGGPGPGAILGALLIVYAALSGSARLASAQQVTMPIMNFRPTTTVESTFLTANGRVLPPLRPSVALYMNYAHNPLDLVNTGNASDQSNVVKYQVNMDLVLALGIVRNFEIGLALPVTLAQGSDDLASIGRAPGTTLGGGLGDVRIVPKLLLYGGPTLTLGVAAALALPTGSKARFLGNDGVAFSPWAIAGIATRPVSLAVNLGVRVRKDQSLQVGQQHVTIGNELCASAGARVPLARGIVDLVGDFYMALAFEEQDAEEVPAEVLGGFRFHLPAGMVANLGAGPGLTRGVGTPTFRVLGALAYGEVPEAPAAPRRALPPPDPDPDRDGILGKADRCPKDPEDKDGFEDADGCPDPDNDQDKIADTGDACPMDPEDVDGWKDADGCPDPDNDEDKIADAQDKCPNEPETVNQVDDEDGCPDQGKGPVQIAGRTVTTPPVYFATNKDVILKKSFGMLTLVAKVLGDNAWIKQVRIAGHTDSQGDDAFNMDLSQRRAASVMRFLIDNGVEQGRLVSEGLGETAPIASNRTSTGRARNRRVEFTILDPPASSEAPPVN